MFKKGEDKGVRAFLAEDVTFEGSFIFNGTANLDCKFTGEIKSDTGTLIVGESADIKGNLEIKHLINKGYIEGEILAEKIENFAPGKIMGNVKSKSFFNQLGAVFDGNCSMTEEKEHAEANTNNEKIVKKLG